MQFSKFNMAFIGLGKMTYREVLFLKQMIILSEANNRQAISLNCKSELLFSRFS